ncbi:hypothetical protein E2C01_056567 [Portunus trituberculatus]|uniref:Uncharacterized protein n=1 Tax=Portunus trituberculatus TaxID=210409 RepID=A0A5B7GUH4_PORTR|nr:hypothetical protein [Portunus trituberculatus]
METRGYTVLRINLPGCERLSSSFGAFLASRLDAREKSLHRWGEKGRADSRCIIVLWFCGGVLRQCVVVRQRAEHD